MSAQPHPVRITCTDDLQRSRLTVFFRLLLGIPHFFWAALLGSAVIVIVFINWFILMFTRKTPDGFHDFVAGYIRYVAHLEAYVLLAANPFPPFYLGTRAPYPVDLEIDPPQEQSRWKTFFRLFLMIPAGLIASTLLWGGPSRGSYAAGGLATLVSFFLWWVGVIRGRAPRGMRDLVVYAVGYAAQTSAYIFLLTDRYPFSSPSFFVSQRETAPAVAELPAAPPPAVEGEPVALTPAAAPTAEPVVVEPPHPVSMSVTGELRRSRVLVFFRLPLAIPHLIWLTLWAILALLVAFLTWICAIFIGRPPRPFHRFLSRFVRYSVHVYAFLMLVGNPFPGFVGKPGSYPVDLELPPLEHQSRWVTFFRGLLGFPALMIAGGLGACLFAAAFLGWFVGLFCGRMPQGLRDLGAYSLRYTGQFYAYLYFVTAKYPDSGPRPDPSSP